MSVGHRNAWIDDISTLTDILAAAALSHIQYRYGTGSPCHTWPSDISEILIDTVQQILFNQETPFEDFLPDGALY